MYADDTSIPYSSANFTDINQTLNSELNDLNILLQGSKLSLNVLQAQVLIVGYQPKIMKITDKTVDHPLFFVDRTKYLGVISDRNLNWEEHVLTISALRFLVQLDF